MAQVKLDLDDKTDDELSSFAQTHIDAMDGNANFTTPVPSVATFQTTKDDYDAALQDVALKKAQLETAVAVKDEKKEDLKEALRSRGRYVQETTKGDAPQILSSALGIRDAATPTTALEQPQDLRASISENAGAVDLQWDRVLRARSYVIEFRLQTETTWTRYDKVPTRSRVTVEGLQSGKVYSFRVRAIGPNDVTSAWSDEAVKMAA